MSRPTARQRGYDARWEKARKTYLRSRPWCVMCAEGGKRVCATVVDHVVPHRGDQRLFWDTGNWQGLCKPHHDRSKAQIERHGYSDELGLDGLPTDPRHPFNQVAP